MLETIGKAAQQAAYQLAALNSTVKNQVLALIAAGLQTQQQLILQANQRDMDTAQRAGLSPALQDRLLLTTQRLAAMIQDVEQVMQLPDPVGVLIEQRLLDNGLNLTRRRVPIGVIGVIYEARPNVTIDVVALAIKSGNALILRGGKETHYTNQALLAVIQQALAQGGLPRNTVQAIDDPDRQWITALLRLDRYVDLIIPRGGAGLQRLCREQATIPVISGGIGVCHLFVDAYANQLRALPIIKNAKVQRPSACNALETLLVHQSIAASILPLISADLAGSGVILHACEQSAALLQFGPAQVVAVDDEDYQREWLSLDLNIKVVSGLTEAIEHIRCYGTQHSESIITQSELNAARFTRAVNAAVVYVNASTRFTDGAQFGLGAEMAISTQKLHVRGPVGLEALTTYQWVATGDHLIRS